MHPRLTTDRPNFERVLYNKLLRFREDQLENYQGPPIEYSVSDYHHAPRKMPPRSTTRMSLRKLSGNRNVSQFSILKDDILVRQSKSYKRQPSVAETEGSYDPFRTSRGQIGRAQPEQARITVLRGRSSSHQQRMSNTSLNRRVVSKASVQNPNLARLQQTDAYSILSSPPANHSSSPNQYSSSIHGRISRCPSKRSLSGSAAVRTSMSYRRGVSFAHMRRRSAAHHLQIGKQRDSASLNLQERYLHDRPNPAPSNQQSLLRSESLLSTASSVICSRKPPPKPAEDVAIRKIKTASHYWKEDTRKVSTELEKACDEAFNRFSMASSVMTATSGTPAPSYHTPATSIGIREASHLSLTGAENDDSRKRGEQAHRDRPLPLLPSYEHIGSFTYQELEKTRALLKKRAAETSSIMSPGYFDDVIAHMDRLMQPSTARIHQLDQRATSTPIKKSDSRQNKEALDRLLSRGPFGLRSTSEPIKQSHGNHSSSRKHGRSTLRIVEDEAPISPTKPLTIRKKSGSTTASAESVVIRRSKENLLYGEENRYDRFQGGERHSAGLGLLENSLEPIVEDEDKENRDPRTAKTHSGEVKKRSWFRRHEATQRTQDDDIGPPLPPKDEPLSHEIQNNGMKRDSKASKRSSNAPSDESRVSDTKKPTGGKGRFFKIFSKRDSKESKSSAEQSCGGRSDHNQRCQDQVITNDAGFSDYNLNDISSMASGSSSQLNRVYMSGAIQNTSTATVSRRQRHSSGKTVTIKPPPVRMIQPQHQNWFARFLRIKPAMSIVCFQVSKVRARKEIGSVFREWRKYGMRDIVIDKAAGRLWARVAEKNCEFFALFCSPISVSLLFNPISSSLSLVC